MLAEVDTLVAMAAAIWADRLEMAFNPSMRSMRKFFNCSILFESVRHEASDCADAPLTSESYSCTEAALRLLTALIAISTASATIAAALSVADVLAPVVGVVCESEDLPVVKFGKESELVGGHW